VRAVELGDHRVHQLLQPDPHLVDAVHRRAVLVEVTHRGGQVGPGEHDPGLAAHLGVDPAVLVPRPRVRLGQVQVRPGGEAGAEPVALGPDGVRGARRGRQVRAGEVRAQRSGGGGRRVGPARQLGADRRRDAVGCLRRERVEPRPACACEPLVELVDDRLHLARRGVQPTPRSLGERHGVALERLRHPGQPAGDHRPVVRGAGGHQLEQLPDLRVRAEDVADRAEVLARPARRQLGLQPLAQEPRAATVVVIGLVRVGECGERGAGQVVGSLHTRWGQVGHPVVTGVRAQ
jgi:hypothetical protein